LQDDLKRLNSAFASLAAGRKNTALRLLSTVVAKEPANQQAWLYLSLAQPREKSQQALNQLLKLNPDHQAALTLSRKLKETPEAELFLSDILSEAEIAVLATSNEANTSIRKAGRPSRANKAKAVLAEGGNPIEFVEATTGITETEFEEPIVEKEAVAQQTPAFEPIIAHNDELLPALGEISEPITFETAHDFFFEQEIEQQKNSPVATPILQIPAKTASPPQKSVITVSADSSVSAALDNDAFWQRAATQFNSPYALRGVGKLHPRPVRRTRVHSRTFVSVTNFGLLLIMLATIILLMYLYLLFF